MNAIRIAARQVVNRRPLSSGLTNSVCGENLMPKFQSMTVAMNHCGMRSTMRIPSARGADDFPSRVSFSTMRFFSTSSDDKVANTTSYDPYEITKSFEDTSYYYPPSEELDPKFLASKYEGMTNEELLDTSTITAENAGDFTWESLMHSPPIRDKNAALPKGTLVGKVVSTKMQKTVNVAVDRYKIHPKYRKRIRYTRKFMAHDEKEVASDGDTVLIVPSQRISKKKHFVLKEIIRAKGQL